MPSPTITIDQARHVAKLARLHLPEARLGELTGQLQSILAYVATIEQADTADVEPMPHAVSLSNVLRDDVVGPSLRPEQVLQNAPQTDGFFFAVPKILGSDEDSAG